MRSHTRTHIVAKIAIYTRKSNKNSENIDEQKFFNTFADAITTMNLTKTYKNRLLSLLLAVVVVAFLGKTLHTHGDDYWHALTQTEDSDEKDFADKCPICHFNLFFWSSFEVISITVYCTVIDSVIIPTTVHLISEAVSLASLRAPPTI